MNAISTFQSYISGEIKFHQCCPESPVRVLINLKGFKPNSTHAIHVHEYGNISSCVKAGPHFNPLNKNHGYYLWDRKNRHAGDLINNITTDNKGEVYLFFEDDLISLFPSKFNIIGRSIVLHEKPDDLGRGKNEESLKTGNAGGRIACVVIGLDKDEHF